ncbi:MAG: tetratricopeptide repeat protein [Kofleriaceae bacterium]|nr:tetratricopeptide repeat protein [Kofleriaceae bacterium]
MRCIALALLVAACHPSAPRAPANAVRTEIEQAEDAEKARKHDEARAHYERAIAVAKDPPSIHIAHREFGETLATWGEVEEARTHLETSVAAIDDDPIAWQMLGIVRHKLGDIPGAFAALEKSKALAPRAWIPRRDLAVLHWKLGHRDAALAEYREMLTLDLPDRLREKVLWAIDQLSKPPPFHMPEHSAPEVPSPAPPAQPPAPAQPPPS